MCCCVFWPGEMTFCSFNTLADGTLRLLTLVQHPPFPTHHQLKNATPTLKPAIVIQPVWNKRDLWPGWGQGGAEVPPHPAQIPPCERGTSFLQTFWAFLVPAMTPTGAPRLSLELAHASREGNSHPGRPLPSFQAGARPPFLLLPSMGSDCP